jgi:hypothetical protein
VLDSEKIATPLDSLTGYSQKGPFLKGSTVLLYELQDGRTLKQTNGNFTSNITRDDGRYKFNARDLVSQYAMLVVDGHYRNEVTGKASNTAIKMKAITDVTARKTANVNLLTHLEFERVYHLVTKEKMKVWAAKRQAQAEILNLFHIDTTGLKGFSSAEDLDVFGKTDADAALLAISILLQGDRTEAELVALLSEISNDIAEDGLWNGSVDNNADSVKAAIADWIFNQDYSRFRKNVASWKLSNSIGYYEKYLESFMSEEYGISCDDSSERTKQTVSNQMSANDGKAVVCHDGRFFVERPVLLPINEEVPYGKLYDSRDRQIYRTVQIGDYTVMAENLDYVDSSTYKVVSERSWCLRFPLL